MGKIDGPNVRWLAWIGVKAREAKHAGPVPMDIGMAQNEGAEEDVDVDAVGNHVRCSRCSGYGHFARDCATPAANGGKGQGGGGKGKGKDGAGASGGVSVTSPASPVVPVPSLPSLAASYPIPTNPPSNNHHLSSPHLTIPTFIESNLLKYCAIGCKDVYLLLNL